MLLTSARLCAWVSVDKTGVKGKVDAEKPDHGAASGDAHGEGLSLHLNTSRYTTQPLVTPHSLSLKPLTIPQSPSPCSPASTAVMAPPPNPTLLTAQPTAQATRSALHSLCAPCPSLRTTGSSSAAPHHHSTVVYTAHSTLEYTAHSIIRYTAHSTVV